MTSPDKPAPEGEATQNPLSPVISQALRGERGGFQQKIARVGLRWLEHLLKKNHDYGSSVFKSPILTPQISAPDSIFVRMTDKIERMVSLVSQPAEIKDESLADTVGDLGKYCLLWEVAKELEEPFKWETAMDDSYNHIGVDLGHPSESFSVVRSYKETFGELCETSGTDMVENLKEFHEAMELRPGLDRDNVEFRATLIREEYKELQEVLKPQNVTVSSTLKELVDLVYVCIGTAVTFGWDFATAWKRVHESNMAKKPSGERVRKRSDGKILKPEGWKAPTLSDLTYPRVEGIEAVKTKLREYLWTPLPELDNQRPISLLKKLKDGSPTKYTTEAIGVSHRVGLMMQGFDLDEWLEGQLQNG